jgi:hypothetical protein
MLGDPFILTPGILVKIPGGFRDWVYGHNIGEAAADCAAVVASSRGSVR